MKINAKLLKIILLLSLLPASAWAVSFSNLQLTTTSFSVDITGYLPNESPSYSGQIFVTNPTLSSNPGFVLNGVYSYASEFSFSGPNEMLNMYLGNYVDADWFTFGFVERLVGGTSLEGTVVGSWSSAAFDPNAVTSLNFYWGLDGEVANSGIPLGSASLSAVPDSGSTAVPDTGSTAALLGTGVVALVFARRRLG